MAGLQRRCPACLPDENINFRNSACQYQVIADKPIPNNVNNLKIHNQDIWMTGIAAPGRKFQEQGVVALSPGMNISILALSVHSWSYTNRRS